jgi:hypothetical protein
MTDTEFLTELETCRLPACDFPHAGHLRAAYLYLRAEPFPQAAARMCATIRRYADALGKPEKYHETVTIGFMALIQRHLRLRGDGGGWPGFLEQNPELLRKDALLAYYPAAVLESAEARATFVLVPLRSAGG